MKIIKERGTETRTWLEHSFRWANTPGWCGYSFSVNEQGELIDKDNECAAENYRLCVSGQMTDSMDRGNRLIDEGVVKRSRTYRTDAVGVCACGAHVELYDQYMGACECPACGQWHNLSGQELLPPRHWEENVYGDYEYEY